MSQISLETNSKLTPDEVIKIAKKRFEEQLGLALIEEADCCVRLEGGGGFVYIRAEEQDDDTKVILEGREWTPQLKQLMKEIAA